MLLGAGRNSSMIYSIVQHSGILPVTASSLFTHIHGHQLQNSYYHLSVWENHWCSLPALSPFFRKSAFNIEFPL